MFDHIRTKALENHIDEAVADADADAAFSVTFPDSLESLMRVLRQARSAVAMLSVVIWLCPPVAALAGWMMLETAVPARSLPSMAGMAALGLIATVAMWAAWKARAAMLVQTAHIVDACLPTMLAERAVDSPDVARRHLAAVRRFLNGSAASAALDVPGAVLAGLLLTAIAPPIGLAMLYATLAMVAAIWRSQRRVATRQDPDVPNMAARFDGRTISALRHAGMRSGARRIWLPALIGAARTEDATEPTAGGRSVARMAMMGIWLLLFVAGGWMAMADRASIPLIAAAQAMALIAVQPLVTLLARPDVLGSFVTGRRALRGWLNRPVQTMPAAALAAPRARLDCDIALLSAPGEHRVLMSNVAFRLSAGEMLAVIGMGGAGKSVLLRALTGELAIAIGAVRLDGAMLSHWSEEMLDRQIGYLPQVPMLGAGTVAENIARFDSQASSEAVLAAARTAGVHDAIVGLAEGYDTQVGDGGERLSFSMRQRIALARACFGDPFLLLLDEPAASADQRAMKALHDAIGTARARGAVVIVVARDSSIVERADRVLALRDGRVAALAPPAELRAAMRRDAHAVTAPEVPTSKSL